MSLRLHLLNLALRIGAKPVLRHMRAVGWPRLLLDRSAPYLFRAPPLSLYREGDLAGRDVLWISNRPGSHPLRPGKVILYLHGGGFIAGSPRAHRHMLARLSRLCRVEVCAPDYRLAPEHPFPAAFEDVSAVHAALIDKGYAPGNIILGGDSAGGDLALALLADLTRSGRSPRALFALSPMTDLEFSGASMVENRQRDPVLPAERADTIRDWYLAGHPADDPRVTPLKAAFRDPPPVFLQYSDSEILRDDSRRMADHLRAAGGVVVQDEWVDCPHVWVLCDGWLPEARVALTRVAGFVTDQFNAATASR